MTKERGLTFRDGVWVIRYTNARGHEVYHRTKGTKEEARRTRRDLQAKVERQRLGLEPLPVAADMTFGALMDW